DENGNGIIDVTEYTSFRTGGEVRSSAAIGDVDQDGDLEVIVGSRDFYLYSLDYDVGTRTVSLNWAQDMRAAIISSPSLADRTGTGALAIYVGTEGGNLAALNGTDGSLIDQRNLSKNLTTSPTVADIDSDGKLEIIISGLDFYDTLYCIEDSGSNVPPRSIEWGKFRHDDRNTGRYGVDYPLLHPPCLNQPPLCDAGGPYVEECQGPETVVTLDGSNSSDPDGDPLTYTWDGSFNESPAGGVQVSATFQGLGVFTVQLTVEDPLGEKVSCNADVTIEDTTPPEVQGEGMLACLWPPNHWYVCLGPDDLEIVASDLCCEPVDIRFTGCRSDQPDDAPDGHPISGGWNGDGHTTEDCMIVQDGQTVCVRAERAGAGTMAQNGRHYAFEVEATDSCGNTSELVAVGNVYVPHDQSPHEKECLNPTKVGCRPNQPVPCTPKRSRAR
ncbi:PKD domain-containing protein, partial [Acidobacteriota bacterium]